MAMTKIVVISGSGLDAESGIPTFRDKDNGLWKDLDVMEVASSKAWIKNRKKVLDFCNICHREFLKKDPNSAHFAIAELEKDFEVVNITQNISNLLEKAGCSNVIHLHGDITKMRTFNSGIYYNWPEGLYLYINSVNDDDELLRPDVVLFGESVPNLEIAEKEIQNADIVLVIGTSFTVYPAAYLALYAREGIPIYVIDPDDLSGEINNVKYTHIKNTACCGMVEFTNIIYGN